MAPLTRSRVPAAVVLAALLAAPAFAQDKDAPPKTPKEAAARAKASRADLQDKLSKGSDILKRFRLDDFQVNSDDQVEIHGVFLQPGFDKTPVVKKSDDPKEPDEKKPADPVAAVKEEFEKLQSDLREFMKAELKTGDEVSYRVPESGVARLGALDHPAVVLQAAANAAGAAGVAAADQLKISGARFDPSGALVLVGARGEGDASRDWLRNNTDKVLAKSPAAVQGGKFVKPRFDGDDAVKPVAWGLTARKLQEVFAASGDRGLERTRIDRVYLAHDPKDPDQVARWTTLKLHLAGVAFRGQVVDDKRIKDECRRLWPSQFADGPDRLDFAAFSGQFDPGIPEPAALFQAAVAARKSLDGVRVDPGSKFGPDGRLILTGVRPKPPEAKPGQPKVADITEAELEACYREMLAELIGRLAAKNDEQANDYKVLAAGPGVSVSGMAMADTRRMLAELRAWAKENRDDVRLSRLYFDRAGKMMLDIQAPNPADFADVRKLLAGLATEVPAPKAADAKGPDATLPVEPKPPEPEPKKEPEPKPVDPKEPEKKKDDEPKKEPEKKDEPKEPEKKEPEKKDDEPKKDEKKDGAVSARTVPIAARVRRDEPKAEGQPQPKGVPADTTDPKAGTIPSFTNFLRGELARDPKRKWSKVLIERGYFDDNDRYAVRGVVDRAEQKAELAALIETFADDPRWAAYFTPLAPGETRGLDLEVIPMADLVARVQRVTPAYEVFDGIRVTAADYDQGANLVFTAHVAGRPSLNDARAKLAELLEKHPSFSRRVLKRQSPALPPRLLVKAEPVVPANDQLGDFSIGFGATALSRGDLVKAKEWIDAGMLHYPNDAAVWFLSAYYNHLTGDRELTRRDLYRMIDVEGRLDFDGPIQRKRRYQAVKDLQGEKRDELEKFWLECWKEVKDGAGPITLVEKK